MIFLDEVKFDAKGLVAAIIQDHENGQVLMLGYMNRDTLRQTCLRLRYGRDTDQGRADRPCLPH